MSFPDPGTGTLDPAKAKVLQDVLASITKTFVASEVMLLAEAKKVDLDAPLSTYVKHKLTANNATVRQHLSMTSGVPNYLPEDYARLDKAIAAAPSKHWTPEQALSYDTAPVGAPNSPYNYSNPSYVLLGMLIEPVSDMTSGDGEYGLGTMLFSQQFGSDPAYGHRGDMPDHSSLLIVIPAKKLSVALLLADGNKHVDTTMTELLTALQPLLG